LKEKTHPEVQAIKGKSDGVSIRNATPIDRAIDEKVEKQSSSRLASPDQKASEKINQSLITKSSNIPYALTSTK